MNETMNCPGHNYKMFSESGLWIEEERYFLYLSHDGEMLSGLKLCKIKEWQESIIIICAALFSCDTGMELQLVIQRVLSDTLQVVIR